MIKFQAKSKQSGHQTLSESKGFTVVEIIVVMVVIGMLAALSIIYYTGITKKTAVATIQSDLKNATDQLGLDNAANGKYPATVGAANGGKGLLKNPNTIYNYFIYSGNHYCLSATSSDAGVMYRYMSNNGAVEIGGCPTITCPTGYIDVPGSITYGTNDFCTMKYDAKNVGGVATSQAAGTPWVSIPQTGAGSATTLSAAACTGCHLITEAEYLTIAQNVLGVASNWSTGTVGSGFIYSGHNDNVPANALDADSNDANGYYGTGNVSPSNQRRTLTLSDGEVIWDLAGNVYEWTSGQTTGGQPGITGESAFAWKEWNATPMTSASFSPSGPNPFPSYGTPAASSWSSWANGIGKLNSYVGDASLRGFRRGCSCGCGSGTGVLTLSLDLAPSTAYATVGFRVSK